MKCPYFENDSCVSPRKTIFKTDSSFEVIGDRYVPSPQKYQIQCGIGQDAARRCVAFGTSPVVSQNAAPEVPDFTNPEVAERILEKEWGMTKGQVDEWIEVRFGRCSGEETGHMDTPGMVSMGSAGRGGLQFTGRNH